jgi:hydroxylamine reductase (hybrid-cluster protein)
MTNITFFSNNQKYSFNGMLGSVLLSQEYVVTGTVRCILGELFYCCGSHKKSYWYPAYSDWISVDKSKDNVEWIREFKKKVCDL